jgi:Uma2 family endonuclease
MAATIPARVAAEHFKKVFEKADFVEIPASIQDYRHLIELPEYCLDYIENQIKGTMSYGSLPHERIIKNLILALSNSFENENYKVFPSNLPLYSEVCEEIYEADVHMIKDVIQLNEYDKTKTANKKPVIIVEVHYASTRNYDLGEKLDCYKAMPSVQLIIYIESTQLKVITHNRTSKPDHWLSIEYKNLNFKVKVLNKFISLRKIYNNTSFV